MASASQGPRSDFGVAKTSSALIQVVLWSVPLSALLWFAILAAVGVFR